jgi:hypothetical protein
MPVAIKIVKILSQKSRFRNNPADKTVSALNQKVIPIFE